MPVKIVSIILIGFFGTAMLLGVCQKTAAQSFNEKKVTLDDHGAIIRGDLKAKEIALVFTGHEFADGGDIILNTLKKYSIRAGFFFTGDFYRNPAFKPLIIKLKREDHYLGAHSDKHLLYADWTKRDSLLVTKEEFTKDLQNNYKEMKGFGIRKEDATLFLPPFEWYNKTIVTWTNEMKLDLINFTPGTRSNADYTHPEMGDRYLSSAKIYQSILGYEASDSNGLNGYLLLIHIGTDPRRTDKFYDKLDTLITELQNKGYSFVRIDKLISSITNER